MQGLIKADLLDSYSRIKTHSVTMLNQNLEESVHSFDELERPSTKAHVLTQVHGQAMRIIFFDPSLIGAMQVLPSSKKLPPGLLEKARSIAEKQRQLLEKNNHQ